MQSTINTIIATLKAGMTTNLSENYYVKTWYTGDPLALSSLEAPAGAVFPTPSGPTSRLTEFVGEDTVTESISIRFYQPAARNSTESPEVAAGITKLIAMVEKAEVLLRADPTFESTFVNSEIINILPLLPGVADANIYRVAEITFQTKSRALWGQ